MLSKSRQLKAARALIGWGQKDVAEAAGVAIGTVRRMETGEGNIRGNMETVRKVQAALEAGGIEFIPEKNGGPGVRLKKE